MHYGDHEYSRIFYVLILKIGIFLCNIFHIIYCVVLIFGIHVILCIKVVVVEIKSLNKIHALSKIVSKKKEKCVRIM